MMALRRAAPVTRSSTGRLRRRDITALVASIAKYMTKPGTMPAMNNCPTEMLTIEPSRMNRIEGGMIGPIDAAAAITPAA